MIKSALILTAMLILETPYRQAPSVSEPDPLEQKVSQLELRDETIGDALGRLNQSLDVSISVEGVLPQEGTTTNPKLNARIEGRSLADTLTWLCTLDTRYTWTRDANNVNVIPRDKLKDEKYFFNRTLPELQFHDVRRVDDAVIAVVHQLGDQNENLFFLGIGGTQSFPTSWTASFSNVTVRQALNLIARKLGPTYGWQVGGTTKARLIAFHSKLGGQTRVREP